MEIIIVLGVYMAGMLGIGAYCSRGIKDEEDFLVNARRNHWIWVFASITATQTGAGATLTVVALTYAVGGAAIWWQVSNGIVFWIFAVTIATYYRKSRCITLSDYIYQHFDKKNRFVVDIYVLFICIGYTAAQIAGMAAFMSALTPLTYAQSAWLGAAVVIVYTFLGGLKAVVVTDLIQLIIVIGAMVSVVAVCMVKFGPVGHLETSLGTATTSIWWDSFVGPTPSSFVWFICMTVSWYVGRLSSQGIFMMNASSKDEKNAVMGSVVGGFFPIFLGILAIWIGMYSQVFIPEAVGDTVMPIMIAYVLPKWIAALMIAGLAAACMSTVDCNLNGSTAHITELCRFWFRAREEKMLIISRVGVIFVGILSVLLVVKLQSVYSLLTLCFDLGAPYSTLLLAPVFYKRCTKNGAFISLLCASVFVFIYKYVWVAAAAQVMPVLPTLVFGFIVMVIASEIDRASGKATPMALPFEDKEVAA